MDTGLTHGTQRRLRFVNEAGTERSNMADSKYRREYQR